MPIGRAGLLEWAACLVIGAATAATAEQPSEAARWPDVLDRPASWYAGAEAARVADNVLLYQRRSGGWPKNIDMARRLTPTEIATVTDETDLNDSTIDNGATCTELRFLARLFEAAGNDRYRKAFLSGIDFLLKAQYPGGGWPQYYPLRENYSRNVTFNDNAMIGAMTLLRDISASKAPYAFVDARRRASAAAAIERGLQVILKSQIRVGGRLTAWCAQIDPVTLEPRGARTYEHPSISGKESVDIVRYLMAIDRPAPAVVAAIEAAIAYYREHPVTGLRLESKPAPALPHGQDVVAVADPGAPPLWARFYEIGSNRPIYSGRDGIVRYTLAEIEPERRAGYSWLGPYATDLLAREYPAWKARVK